MLPLNLDDLIQARAVEDNRREFKATWDEQIKPAVVRTICAFANDLLNLNGGYIIIGVETNDRGEPLLPPRGLDLLDVEKIQKEIRGQCRRIDPEYQPVLFPEVCQGKRILVVWAPGGDTRPYQAPKQAKGGERAYYVRQGPETVEAQGELLRQLLERTAKVPFDDRRNLASRVEDISPTLMRRFLANVRSDLVHNAVGDREIYQRMRLVSKVNEHEAPRNVALLFFHEDPDKFFPGARIEIVQFADGAGGNLLEERTIRGSLPEQIRLTLDYLHSMADVMLQKAPGRAEVDRTVAYPYEAMEEAIVNALYHRSYEDTPEPTKVYLYPGRMEIISYPGPVQGVTRESLSPGRTVPPVPARNRRLGELLKELRLAEARGTGLPKIWRKMKENGSPDPTFDFDEGRTYFRVVLPAHPRYRALHALRESARLWSVGSRSEAVAHVLSAFEQQPGSGALAGQLIEYAMAAGDPQLAGRVFDRFRAEKLTLETAQPYLRYAAGLWNAAKPDQARRVLEMLPAEGLSDEDVQQARILDRRVKG